ncbi:MAG: AmmeMemoRadiSam system radical SAM enzyme [Deltaproteobacteria bacterium]|nr:AmmeMemoRadiSam system radical SAM enzyme [Deltaproteobacteria bacterium]
MTVVSKRGREVVCELCPKLCRIAPGESGECRVRVNIDGELVAVTYGFPSAIHVDPVEKKPFFHFMPGSRVVSVATVGCNLHCKNCQNWQLSQQNPEVAETYRLGPERLVALARREACPSIAYTYAEPIVFYEYTLDASRRARAVGLKNLLVTAGYGNPDPMKDLFAVTDAANIDLKFFDDALYRQICDASLAPILDFIVQAKAAGVWVELTNLVIPTLNDDEKNLRKMCRWIVRDVGADTPLHLSRFSPQYKLKNLPPTPVSTLVRLRAAAKAEGLRYVYVGNVPGSEGENTCCPHDGTLLVKRQGYHVSEVDLEFGADGRACCPTCKQPIPGVWR